MDNSKVFDPNNNAGSNDAQSSEQWQEQRLFHDPNQIMNDPNQILNQNLFQGSDPFQEQSRIQDPSLHQGQSGVQDSSLYQGQSRAQDPNLHQGQNPDQYQNLNPFQGQNPDQYQSTNPFQGQNPNQYQSTNSFQGQNPGQYQNPNLFQGQNLYGGHPQISKEREAPRPSGAKPGTALGLGIAACVLPIPIVDIVFVIVGYVLLYLSRKEGYRGGLWVAALVLTTIGAVFSVLYNIFILFAVLLEMGVIQA